MAATDRSLHVRMGQVGKAVSRLDIFCLWRTSSAVFVLVRIAFEQMQLIAYKACIFACSEVDTDSENANEGIIYVCSRCTFLGYVDIHSSR